MRVTMTEREFEVICESLMEGGHRYLALKIMGAHEDAYAKRRFQPESVVAR